MKNTVDAWIDRIYGQNRSGIRGWGLVLDVSLRLESQPLGGPLPKREPPRLYRPAVKVEDRNAVRYAVWGLHWILRGWRWWSDRRWAIESFLFELRWMEGDHHDAPTFRSLRFGNPIRIMDKRERCIRDRARTARDYAISRARAEGAQLTAEQLEELRRMMKVVEEEKAGYKAHAASFGALQEISMLTDLAGEVDEYSDVVKAVGRLRDRATELGELQPIEARR